MSSIITADLSAPYIPKKIEHKINAPEGFNVLSSKAAAAKVTEIGEQAMQEISKTPADLSADTFVPSVKIKPNNVGPISAKEVTKRIEAVNKEMGINMPSQPAQTKKGIKAIVKKVVNTVKKHKAASSIIAAAALAVTGFGVAKAVQNKKADKAQ